MSLETEIIKELPNLGIGIVGILAIVLVTFKFQDTQKKERQEFMNFITDHNHRLSELVCESTKAITKSSENIAENTRVLTEVGIAITQMRRYKKDE